MSVFSNLDNISDFDISFNISNVDLSIINAIRRIIISEIPNVGFLFNPNDVSQFQHIKVISNTSSLHNELIQQRFALIPIHVNIEELENWNEEDFKFVVDIKNDSSSILNIYSSDIQVMKNNEVDKALTKRFFPPDPISKDHILLTKLKPVHDAKINIEAKATLNIAANFTSFGIVSTCAFEHVIDEELANKTLRKFLNDNENKDTIENLTYQFNSIDRERCYHRNKFREPNLFKFHVVSESSIPSSYIFKKALQILKDKVIKLQDLDFEVLQNDSLFSVVIRNESHTLGNVYQSLCFNRFIRQVQEDKTKDQFNLKYIGYNVPHPLESILLIKLKGDDIKTIKDVKLFITQGCEYIIDYISDLEDKWKKFG
jgi:DNA-directed RNA polymerase subunit L